MIYIGYYCIGKSMLSSTDLKYIDLDSNIFLINEGWYKYYANVANNLSSNGYTVFTTLNEQFKDYLKENNIEFTVIYPGLGLKNQWLSKLKLKYERTKTSSDYIKFKLVEKKYDEDIQRLSEEINHIEIHNEDYDLEKIIEEYELWKKSTKE